MNLHGAGKGLDWTAISLALWVGGTGEGPWDGIMWWGWEKTVEFIDLLCVPSSVLTG